MPLKGREGKRTALPDLTALARASGFVSRVSETHQHGKYLEEALAEFLQETADEAARNAAEDMRKQWLAFVGGYFTTELGILQRRVTTYAEAEGPKVR